jgi:type VI protein secretion system component VasF
VNPCFAARRLNRKGGKARRHYPTARSEITTIFEQMNTTARTDLALSEQFRKVEMPLIFFVDSMISESSLRFAAEWNRNRLAYERNELAGDEKFFDLLDETLRETRDGVEERLAVFFTCLGLGFSGWYAGQPEYLRKKMLEIAPRVKAYVDADETGLITPDNTSTPTRPTCRCRFRPRCRCSSCSAGSSSSSRPSTHVSQRVVRTE